MGAFSILFSGAPVLLAEVTLLDGFEEKVVVSNINAGTAFTILPDGRVIYAEQTGYLHVVANEELLPDPALDISERLDTYWERGLVGITHDPDFPQSPYLYLVYVAKYPFTHHVVSRFTLEGNRVDLSSERILLKGDDQSKIAGRVPAGHQGGPIRYGPDGKLYIAIGEHLNGQASQSLTTFQGKILRINPDGSIPENNPFYRQTYGKYRAIYVLGIRNPWGMDFMPGTTRLFESDVGQTTFEEINEIFAGHNYGWPNAEGFSELGEYTNPIHAYSTTVGRCIGGGAFYPIEGNFPGVWKGKYFFVDWAANWVKAIDVDQPDQAIDFAKDLDSPVWNEVHPDGSLWVLNRGTIWRDGNKFEENSGSLIRLRYVGEGKGGSKEEPFPELLSQTGIFENLSGVTPTREFIAFEMNAPVWRSGVKLRNWMKIPRDKTIRLSKQEDWIFPEGSVLVQHFDSVAEDSFETHVYWSRGDGKFRAAAYKWMKAGHDAELIKTASIGPLPGAEMMDWFSPGPERILDPRLALIGFVPQFNTRQLNRGNQLRDWSKRGLLDQKISAKDLKTLPRLASLENESTDIDLKVRSYLDANCAVCHQPGGPSRGNFDARFITPLGDQRIVNGELIAGDMGIAGARVVILGDPGRSILLQRLTSRDALKMPPVAVHGETSPLVPYLEEWIREMDTDE
jgi:glucose/arabinose dehydrogenase/mono/diheme cytochrome c family protein